MSSGCYVFLLLWSLWWPSSVLSALAHDSLRSSVKWPGAACGVVERSQHWETRLGYLLPMWPWTHGSASRMADSGALPGAIIYSSPRDFGTLSVGEGSQIRVTWHPFEGSNFEILDSIIVCGSDVFYSIQALPCSHTPHHLLEGLPLVREERRFHFSMFCFGWGMID